MFILRSPLPVPPPVAYVGPGDVVSGATAFWGLRAYTDADIGDNVVRLRRDSDNTEQNFPTIAGGGLNAAAISGFAGGANLFIVTLFDQTGNGHDVTQSSVSNQPGYDPTGIGSLPVIDMSLASQTAVTSGGLSLSQPFTVIVLGFAVLTNQQLWGESATIPVQYGTHASSTLNQWYSYDNSTITATATDAVWHTGYFVSLSGAGDGIYIDGSFTGGTNSDSSLSGTFRLGPGGGYMAEAGIWPIAFSGGNSAAMNANQAAYWGY